MISLQILYMLGRREFTKNRGYVLSSNQYITLVNIYTYVDLCKAKETKQVLPNPLNYVCTYIYTIFSGLGYVLAFV